MQSSFQPTADSLLAERLISSSLAGPSSVPSVTQVAQRVSNAQFSNTIAGLGRLYSSLTRAGASGSAAVGPKQQVGLNLLPGHLLHKLFCLVQYRLAVICRPMQPFRDHCGDISAVNHHVKVCSPVFCARCSCESEFASTGMNFCHTTLLTPPCTQYFFAGFEKFYPKNKQRRTEGKGTLYLNCLTIMHSFGFVLPAQQGVPLAWSSAGKSDKKGPEETPEFKQLLDSLTKSSGNIIAGVGIIAIAMFMRNLTRPDTQEISFQHFKTQLLAKDVVDRIEVANKTTAKVQPCCNRGFPQLIWAVQVRHLGFQKLKPAGKITTVAAMTCC